MILGWFHDLCGVMTGGAFSAVVVFCFGLFAVWSCLAKQRSVLQRHHPMQSLCYLLATLLVVDTVLSFSPGVSLSVTTSCDHVVAVDRRGRLRRTCSSSSSSRHVHVSAALKSDACHGAPAVSSTSPLKGVILDATAAGVSEDALGDKELSGRCSYGRPLVDAKQLSPQELRRRWPDSNFDVPATMPEALKTFFFEQPTPRLIVAGSMVVVAARLFSCGVAFGTAEAVAIPAVVIGWSFQEWAIHKYLLHGVENWLGYDVHKDHHDKPFYHVCVDPPDLVAGWTVAAACIFRLVLPEPLALTVLAIYMVMGLVYEWTHYIVHTRVVPRTRFGKEQKRHHTLHHLKDETCWLAFTVPQIDRLLGTSPRVGAGSKWERGADVGTKSAAD